MLGECQVGQPFEVTLNFFDKDGVTPKDPTGASASVKHPDGTTVDPYTPVKQSLGIWTFTFVPSASGKWWVKGVGTGANGGVDEDYVLVNDSQFD